MTKTQEKVYKDIVKFRNKHGYSPAPTTLAEKYGVTRQNIENIVKILIKKGYLRPLKSKVGLFEPIETGDNQVV